MLTFQLALVAVALVSSAGALLSLFVQRDDRRFPMTPERRALFGILLLDASLQWVSIARFSAGRADAAWMASFILLIAANVIVGFVLLMRGHALANLVRWAGVIWLLILEPILLGFCLYVFAQTA